MHDNTSIKSVAPHLGKFTHSGAEGRLTEATKCVKDKLKNLNQLSV